MYAGTIVLFVTFIAATQAAKKNDDRIHFPGPIKEYNTETRYGTPVDDDVPEKCRNKNYCTIKPKNYPQEKFDNLIKYKNFKLSEVVLGRLKRDTGAEGNSTKFENGTQIPVSPAEAEISDLVDKQGDPDEVDNCETIVEFEPLFKVKTKEGDWRNVVQAPEKNFVQSVRMETCRQNDAPCFTVFPKIPSYTTFCKQKYTTWHFVVESEDGSKEEKIPIDLPTCCSCHYKPS